MECYFTFEQGMFETQIYLSIYVDLFWIQNVQYLKLVRPQYLENCDKYLSSDGTRLHYICFDVF